MMHAARTDEGRSNKEKMMNLKRRLATTSVAAGVLGGSIVGSTLVSGVATAAGRATHVASRAATDAVQSYCLELGALVNTGTITQAQADAVRSAMIVAMASANGDSATFPMSNGVAGGFMRSVLNGLVTNGTITQSQANAIFDAMIHGGMMGGYGAAGAFDQGGMMGGTSSFGGIRYGSSMGRW